MSSTGLVTFRRSPNQVGHQTNTTRSDTRNPFQLTASRQDSILFKKLETAHTRPLDSRHSNRIQDSLHKGATTDSAASLFSQAGGSQDYFKRNRFPARERSYTSNYRQKRLHKQYIFGTKDRREVEADSEPEGPKPVCNTRTLQNGRHLVCEGSHQPRRSYVQTEFKGCISVDSHPQVIPQISLARCSLRVHSPPIWAVSSTTNLHESSEASTSSIESQRDTPSSIFRRSSHYWEGQGMCRRGVPDDKEPLACSWLCGQSGKISELSSTEDRVPWIHHQFQRDDVQDSHSKGEANQKQHQANFAEGTGDSERTGSHSGSISIHSPSSLASTATLPCTSGTKERRSSPPPLIRVDGDFEFSELGRPAVVDQSPEQKQQQANSSPATQHGDRIRCI